ncbi:uncharacterized protein LOC114306334 [Camellia sinensis]|uniref:uncharacterized protein LOC114306334 n=1 Tax=Camellia sinensis TaxID=4442 RepID=UPI001035C6DC|nr:uncharacterized protein LOC114306334 [Camellia sinensis]
MEYVDVDADGSAGGLLCIWNPERFKLVDCYGSRNFIILSGTVGLSFDCSVVNLYAPNDVCKRRQLWELLKRMKISYPNPWCMGGDFNEIRFLSERKGCSRRERGMNDSNELVDQLSLVDLPMRGRSFTWCNVQDGERWSRIDRFLLESSWLEFSFKQWGLPRTISDHCPVLLMEDERNWGPKAFRFINAWLLHPTFKTVVKSSGDEEVQPGWARFRLMRKLATLRVNLKRWNSEVFGHVETQLKQAEEDLHALDLVAEERSLSKLEVSRRREVRGQVWNPSTRRVYGIKNLEWCGLSVGIRIQGYFTCWQVQDKGEIYLIQLWKMGSGWWS